MLRTLAFASTLLASSLLVAAHPGEEHHAPTGAELARRSHQAAKRTSVASKCANHIGANKRARRAKRAAAALKKRDIDASSLTTAEYKGFSTIQNSSCVTAPEVTEGPYYINNELVRQDLRETQAGIDLVLDIGVIDINTCEPLDNVYVEIWACNATGQYSGFTTAQTAGGGGMQKRQGMSTSMTDDYSFGRGGWPTNDEGVVEFTTTFPGFYTGRTVHTHLMVHDNYTIQDDGTINSAAGTIYHIGQIFYDEDLLTQVLATSAYTNTTQTRTLNADDTILTSENTDGNNAYADTSLIGESIEDGVLAYITIGVDSTLSDSITSSNTATAIDSSIQASALSAATAGSVNADTSLSSSAAATAGSTSVAATATATGTVAEGVASATATGSFASKMGGSVLAAGIPVLGAVAFFARG
ncbi:Intradiol ring-cleavage dioxygenase [Leucosporidium creatinivorum]|uniref:Intradiol ring-cleavage dioxygenase n=1 Tax=Leucosporidium creatinivorum TaxID=106004 RepID=A0A1Y2EL30_9BASI|nr:Intradiol ring-cleavage dioxygenase [Leucosporidium creatinivorum]